MRFQPVSAVMYGAGNIGRGFIGMLFSQSGYRVTFVDVAQPLVEQLHARGSYPVRILEPGGYEDVLVEGVDALDGTDAAAVARAIAGADVMATAVGANILPRIARNIAEGLKLRRAKDGKPLNILICENLMDANRVLRELIFAYLTEEERHWCSGNVGFVEASIGRMVPVQTKEMQDGDALRVCVERYGYLPVDRDAFRGNPLAIRNLVPFSPFDFYIRRKLYLHNMGHAVTAYLGLYTGKELIADAIDEPEILLMTQGAMLESAQALSKQYGVPLMEVLAHMQDLLRRFTNRSLGDTCARVGADIPRKLSSSDRLIGAARLCEEAGVTPAFLCVGAAGAAYEYLRQSGTAQTEEHARDALERLSGLGKGNLMATVLRYYALFASGGTLYAIRRAAQAVKAESGEDIV